MTTTKTTQTPTSPVETFILQVHQGTLIRATATRISSRVLCATNAAFIIFMNHLSPYQMLGSALVAILISLIWNDEQKLLNIQLRKIEETLAKRSGDEWEDIYIKLRYVPSGYSLWRRFIRVEPFLWLLIIGTLIVLRIFTPNTPA